MDNTKILFVDDDSKILKGIQRQMGDDFDISIALSPFQALKMVEEEGEFAVVVSDIRMPEMNGIELLKQFRETSPDTVRMILTGFVELTSTIQAVNQGHIFRFLAKPCSPEDLAFSLNAGLRQFGLVEAEKELVEGTLHGSVKVLSEVLSLVNPLAFGQSVRIRSTVDGILKHFPIDNQWQLEIAAMLSSLGCVTLPQDLLRRKLCGEKLSLEEENTFSGHPSIAMELLHAVPRLERVAEIIANQNTPSSVISIEGRSVPIESRILKIAFDFDLEELRVESPFHALNELKLNGQQYDPDIFDALSTYIKTERNLETIELMIRDLFNGMVLADNVTDENGTLIMSKGQEMTASARRLLANFSKNKAIKEPVKVVSRIPSERLNEPVPSPGLLHQH